MQQADVQWSDEEKQIARAALKRAYEQEVEALIDSIRKNASKISQLEEVWQLHDFLSAKRHAIDGRYDERDDLLMIPLSSLNKDGLLTKADLTGLTAGTQAKINLLARM